MNRPTLPALHSGHLTVNQRAVLTFIVGERYGSVFDGIAHQVGLTQAAVDRALSSLTTRGYVLAGRLSNGQPTGTYHPSATGIARLERSRRYQEARWG